MYSNRSVRPEKYIVRVAICVWTKLPTEVAQNSLLRSYSHFSFEDCSSLKKSLTEKQHCFVAIAEEFWSQVSVYQEVRFLRTKNCIVENIIFLWLTLSFYSPCVRVFLWFVWNFSYILEFKRVRSLVLILSWFSIFWSKKTFPEFWN